MPLELSYIFQALAHNHRRLILQELAKGPKPVGETRPWHFGTPSALSKHVKILERAQLIGHRRFTGAPREDGAGERRDEQDADRKGDENHHRVDTVTGCGAGGEVLSSDSKLAVIR